MTPSDYANELATWGVFENTIKRFEADIKDLPPERVLHFREELVERIAYSAREQMERLLEALAAGDLDDLDIKD